MVLAMCRNSSGMREDIYGADLLSPQVGNFIPDYYRCQRRRTNVQPRLATALRGWTANFAASIVKRLITIPNWAVDAATTSAGQKGNRCWNDQSESMND